MCERNLTFECKSLKSIVYELVLYHVRERHECLDGFVSSSDGVVQSAVTIQRRDSGLVAIVYQDTPLTDEDKEAIAKDIKDDIWEEEDQ